MQSNDFLLQSFEELYDIVQRLSPQQQKPLIVQKGRAFSFHKGNYVIEVQKIQALLKSFSQYQQEVFYHTMVVFSEKKGLLVQECYRFFYNELTSLNGIMKEEIRDAVFFEKYFFEETYCKEGSMHDELDALKKNLEKFDGITKGENQTSLMQIMDLAIVKKMIQEGKSEDIGIMAKNVEYLNNYFERTAPISCTLLEFEQKLQELEQVLEKLRSDFRTAKKPPSLLDAIHQKIQELDSLIKSIKT